MPNSLPSPTDLTAFGESLLEALIRGGGRLDPAQADALDAQLAALTAQVPDQTFGDNEAALWQGALALHRVRAALGQGDWATARLLLAGLAAQPATASALWVPMVRLQAVLAIRLGRADEAAALLAGAAEQAAAAGDAAQLVLVRSEQILALAQDEQWAAALEVARQPLAADLSADPEALAARSEAVAVLAAQGGDTQTALEAAAQALALRATTGDASGWLRAAALLLQLDDEPTLLAEAEQLAASSGRLDLLVRVELARGRRLLSAGQWSLQAAAELASLAASSAGPIEQLAALDLHCTAALQAGQLPVAAATSEQAVRLAEALAAPRWTRRAHVRHAQVLALQGESDAALRQAAAVADAASEADDAQVLVRAWLVAGPLLHRLGRLEEAIALLQQTVRVASERQLPILAAEAAVELGRAQLSAQQWRDAEAAFVLAGPLANAHGLVALGVDAARGAVLALRGAGDASGAANRASEALAEFAHLPAQRLTAGLCIELAQIALDAGATADASGWLARIPDDAPPSVRGEAAILAARVALAGGGPDAAVTPLLQAVGLLRVHGPVRSLGAAQFLLGQVYGLLGEHMAAGRWLGEALVLTTQHRLPEQHLVAEVLRRAQQAAAATPPAAEA